MNANVIEKTKINKSDGIKIIPKGELMHNYFSEKTIEPSKGIVALPLFNDTSLLILIEDHQLKGFVSTHETKSKSKSGWIDFTISLDGHNVSAFDVHFSETSHKLKICYSSDGPSGMVIHESEVIDLSTLKDLEDDPFGYEDLFQGKEEPREASGILKFLENVFANWIRNEVQKALNVKRISHVSINDSHCVFGYHEQDEGRDEDAKFGYFEYGQHPVTISLASNEESIFQAEAGIWDNDSGVFVLSGDDLSFTSLNFYPFDYPEMAIPIAEDDDSIQSFSLVKSNVHKRSDKVYIGGDELGVVQWIEDQEDPEYSTITEATDGMNFTKIISAERGDKKTIWALDNEGILNLITNEFHEHHEGEGNLVSSPSIKSQWTEPLGMYSGVMDFVALRGENLNNQLFHFSIVSDGREINKTMREKETDQVKLLHFWQCPVSTHWKEDTIKLPHAEKMHEIYSYTSHISFHCEDTMKAFSNEEVMLSAETNMLVYINQVKQHIGPNKKLKVNLNDGMLNIVYSTGSLSSGKLYVEGEFIDGVHVLNPTDQVRSDLGNKISDDNLANAKKNDGEKLFRQKPNDEDLKNVKDSTGKMLDGIKHLNGEKSEFSAEELDMLAWELQFDELLEEQLGWPSFKKLGHAFGNIIHSIKKGITKITKVVSKIVDEGVQFAIHIGDLVLNFIVDAALHIYHFLEKVWNKLKIFFKDLFEFLAFLFEWESFLRTKEVLKDLVNFIIDTSEKSIQNLESKLADYFNSLEKKIDDIKESIDGQSVSVDAHAATNHKVANDSIDQENCPKSSWIKSKKSHIIKGTASKEVHEVLDSVAQLQKAVVESDGFLAELEDFGEKLGEDGKDLYHDFQRYMKGELTFMQFLEIVGLIIAKAGVQIIEELVKFLFKGLEELLQLTKVALNKEIHIPFFSKLYESISKDPLTILDFMSLIAAIPFTIVYKIGEKVEPFPENEKKRRKEFVEAPRAFVAFDF
ncbi:MAG: hypothetical protein AAGA77_22235 [Bacteroidota bacterium]